MKSKIPYYFIALIVTFMLLDFAFVTLAKLTYTGVYTDNHYKKGINFNKIYGSEVYHGENSWHDITTLDNIKLTGETKLELNINKPQQITFNFIDNQNKPIKNAVVIGKLLRPVTDKYDSTFPLNETSHGVYSTTILFPKKGQWHIRIKALLDNKEYISTAKIVIS